ncbi:PAS domain S-box protein [Niveispirillum sp. KHB5.9]|uniref:hybrid sensor histidine kinase/response regulator n=1 Tax=Niveispirillum sp. KHB5.9 TaxID=3400269 RepID=UPI003A8C74D1
METKQQLDPIHTEEGSFRLLVEKIVDYAIYMLDSRGTILSWNAGAQRSKGYEAAEIIGRHFSCFYVEEDRAAGLPERALRMAASEGKFEQEGWRVRKDGTRMWAHVVIDPIHGLDGEIVGFAKVTRDISDRKAAEESLRQSERQFRLLVQSVTDYAFYMLDPDGRVSSWNVGAQRIKGYQPDEIIGRHFSCFYTEEDRLAREPEKALQAATAGRYEREGWRVRKDGSRFMANVVIDAMRDDDGSIIGYAKITRDVTDQQQAQLALEKVREALFQSQKMEAMGQLTGGIAHDFNNLLHVIGGNLQLLSRDVFGNERAEQRIQNAMSGVERGAKLASQLLAFGRRQPLAPKVVNVGRLIRGMDEILRRSLGEAIEVETIISGGLWNTLVDRANIENALLNLAINARDAMDGRGQLTIEVGNAFLDADYARAHSEVTAGQYVMLAVTDTGSGIPAEIIDKVFDPFFTTKPEGKGTGLGLSMVYGFVKQSGGHIKIYSELGHGTTVKLYLPRSTAVEDAVAFGDEGAVVGGSETILVAEDDDEVREVVVAMLSELGYRVLRAKDAESAMAIVESGAPIDLLFTDVVMPGRLKSTDLARRARQRLPNLQVVFTSGYTENAIVHGGRLDENVELISKPYTREALARKLRNVFAIAAQRKKDLDVEAGDAVGSPESPRQTVLVCEDESLILASTVEMLLSLGHVVLQASNGNAALSTGDQHQIDILLTDVGLPDMSGVVLAKRLRDKIPALKVVFATGRDRVDGMLTGPAIAILSKPYTQKDLDTVLRQLSANDIQP